MEDSFGRFKWRGKKLFIVITSVNKSVTTFTVAKKANYFRKYCIFIFFCAASATKYNIYILSIRISI